MAGMRNGNNRITLAIDDAMTPTAIKTGVLEEDATIIVTLMFFTETTTAVDEYSATIRPGENKCIIEKLEIKYY